MQQYTDIDYEQFPVADLTLDQHWIFLPAAVLLERRKAEETAKEKNRLAELPADHRIILIPAHLDYAPREEELWPLINDTVQKCLGGYPEVKAKVIAAVDAALAAHRGWRNPDPPPKAKQVN